MWRRASVALAVVALVAVATAPSAAAQTTPAPSAGCELANKESVDGRYQNGGLAPMFFNAGERITVAAAPGGSGGQPTTITLFDGANALDAAAYPGTVEFVIPSSGTYALNWSTDEGGAIWQVSCITRSPGLTGL